MVLYRLYVCVYMWMYWFIEAAIFILYDCSNVHGLARDKSGHRKEAPGLELFGLRSSGAGIGTTGGTSSSGGGSSVGGRVTGASPFPTMTFKSSGKKSNNGYENITNSSGHGGGMFSIEGEDDNNNDDDDS